MTRTLQRYLLDHHPRPVARAAAFAPVRWPVPRDVDVWMREVPALAEHGAAALALRRVPEGPAFNDVRRDLREHALEDGLQTMLMTARTVPMLDELRRAGIPFVVIKGPAAARFHPQLDDRPYTDIDVVVPGALFSRARLLLESLGLRAQEESASPWPVFDRWCREGVNLFDDGGAAVDLHHHIPPWRWGRQLTFERLRSRAEHLDVVGLDVPVACAAHQLAISVLHVLSDSWHRAVSMLTLADIVNIAQLDAADEIAAELRHLRVDWICAELFDALPDGVIPSTLRSQLRSYGPRHERFLVGAMLPPSLPARHPIGFGIRLPARNMLAFALGSAVPSPSYVRERFGPRRAYATWWAQAGRWGVEAARGRDVGTPYALDRR